MAKFEGQYQVEHHSATDSNFTLGPDQKQARNPKKGRHIRKAEKHKKRSRWVFFWDSFNYACSLLEEKKSRKLEVTEQELEEHIKNQLGDQEKNIPLGFFVMAKHLTNDLLQASRPSQTVWNIQP